ncbi:DUF2486 family protein [Paraburkholderia sp. Ac-20340]|uniref:DUF2486 family protein n=1 Tax=Paraburkholderia sp. Ac-20340 TaxID=2703888 RepID=UPI001981DDFE|nr:DUF2486 family protein [Paraburkholderia sp. Ac-20340]
MTELHDLDEAPIPLLSDIMVPGNLLRARSPFERVHEAQTLPVEQPVQDAAPEPVATPATAETMAAAHAVPEPTLAQEPEPQSAPQDTYALYAQDADALVERLRGRALSWLTGEGRGVIEQRCSAAMQEHSHWIVGQVSREIGLALETELKGWVKAAVREELDARATHGTPPSA